MGSVTSPQTPPLAASAKLGWAFGQFGIASHMAIVSIYLLYYLTEVHHVPAALAGVVVLIPRIWNIITDPLMGAVSDRTRSRWGRRRPYLFSGSLLWGISFAAMFALPAFADPTVAAAWFCVLYLLVNSGVSLYHVPYSAMAPEMAPDYQQRLSLVSYKEIASRMAVLLAISTAPLLIEQASSPLIGYRHLGFAFGGLILISGMVVFFSTAQVPAIAFQPQAARLRDQLRILKQNRPLATLGVAYLFGNVATAAFSGMLIYFITTVHGQPAALMGVLYPLSSLTSMAMTPVWARLAARTGKREACLVAYAGLGLCWIFPLLVGGEAVWPLYLLMVVYGVFNAGAELLPNAMVPDTIEYDELNTGWRREGTIYGAWVFIQQTGMALGGFMVSVVLALVGFGGMDAIADQVQYGIRYSIALLPLLFIIIAMLLVRRYPINAQVFEQIRTQLLQRQTSAP